MYSLSAFKAYDIRGIYKKEIDLELAYLVANAIKLNYKISSVVIGMDARHSSSDLVNKLAHSFCEIGVNVINIGLCTTPMLNFAVATEVADFGIMVSASHNPKQYNAFKLISKGPIQVGEGNGLKKIKIAVSKKLLAKVTKKAATQINLNILGKYLNYIKSKVNINLHKNANISIDFGNGVGAISALPLFNLYKNINNTCLFEDPNGDFPNHDANPHNLVNFKSLQNTVKKNQSDFGVFFDGDADRCYFVDELGNVVMHDLIVCLLVEHELKSNLYKSKNVYYDLRFTREIKNVISRNGGVAHMLPVGNPLYKKMLNTKGGVLGAEFSGHVMFSQNYNIDDGLFLLLKVLEIYLNSNKPFSELIKKFKTYFTSEEISIPFVKELDFNLLKNLCINKFKDYDFVKMDGIYLQNNAEWFSLRKSNTENILRFRCEAATYERLIYLKEKVLTIINDYFLVK